MATLRQDLQAANHASLQLQLQCERSQALIEELSASRAKAAAPSADVPRLPLLRQRLQQTGADGDLIPLDARRLDRMHPTDLERLTTLAETNLYE